MAQLIIAAAGAAIGGATLGTGVVALGMTGPAIGWMAGSMVGAMLLKPPAPQGPRLEDKKVSSSTYGNAIPVVWGTDRCAAQIIWSSDLIEHEEEVGGKGFGDGATIYTYSVNVYICVCESPFAKPRYPLRLWGNGRLIGTFNGQSWDVDDQLISRAGVREYIGAADQMPDAVYEAAVGVANAPAYRGRLTIMLEGLWLTDFGNRVPNFELEVTSEFDMEPCPSTPMVVTDPVWPYIYPGSGGSQRRFAGAYDPQTRRYFVPTRDVQEQGAAKQIEVYDVRAGVAPKLRRVISLGGISKWAQFGGVVIDPENRVLWAVFGYDGPISVFDESWGGPVAARIDLDFLSVLYSESRISSYWEVHGGFCYPVNPLVPYVCPDVDRGWGHVSNPSPSTGDGSTAGSGAIYGAMLRVHPNSGSPAGEISWGISGSAAIQYRLSRLVNGDGGRLTKIPCPDCWTLSMSTGLGWHDEPAVGAANLLSDVLYVPQPDFATPLSRQWIGGINYQLRYGAGGHVRLIGEQSSTPVVGATIPELSDGSVALFSRARRKVFIVTGKKVGVIDVSMDGDPASFTGEFVELASMPDFYGRVVWSEHLDAMVVIHFYAASMIISVVDPEADELVAGPCNYPEWPGIPNGGFGAIAEVSGGWFIATSQGGWGYPDKIVQFKAPGARAWGGCIPLSEIVDDVWARSGGDPFAIETSELTDCVPGYTVARQAAGRGVLEPLRAAYFFDGIESGAQLKFRKRGKTEVAIIDSGELGARIWSATANDPAPAYEQEHVDSLDAPRELTVEYINAAANYDPGTQRAARQVGGSLAPSKMTLPVVLSDDYAAQVAWTTLMMLHGAKNPIKLALTHAREALEPADAILLPMANGEYQRVVITNRTSARPLLEVEGVIEDPAVWDAIFPGVRRGQGPRQDDVPIIADTLLEIMDLPPLRTEDDAVLLYFAVSRTVGDAWPGAAVYRINESSIPMLYNTTAEATIGELTDALPAWTGGNRWDRTNEIRVRLYSGSLASATRLDVLNGANAAVVGDEILQFQSATLVGEDEWELRTLLRHRLATEWAAKSAHAIGTRFVLLHAGTVRTVSYEMSEFGSTLTYRAVTFGQPISGGMNVAATPSGRSAAPPSPVHIRGTRDGSGNLTATWIRRARINFEWRDDFDVPLDEPSEQYLVRVFATAARATVVRTAYVSTPEWTYTAAQQTADLGGLRDPVYVDIRQLGMKHGIFGFSSEATL